MLGAHWDAYGIGKPDAQGRTIRPGANDDGLGAAGVLEMARAFEAAPRPDRTVVFALWSGGGTGDCSGSETYAVAPVYPAAKTVANLTLDILQTAGPVARRAAGRGGAGFAGSHAGPTQRPRRGAW